MTMPSLPMSVEPVVSSGNGFHRRWRSSLNKTTSKWVLLTCRLRHGLSRIVGLIEEYSRLSLIRVALLLLVQLQSIAGGLTKEALKSRISLCEALAELDAKE
jgi:hypothetical protein